MAEVVASIGPIALAIALSPLPIVPMLLLLATPRGRTNGGGFLGGFLVGVFSATFVVAALPFTDDAVSEPPNWTWWVRIALGAALALVAIRAWLDRDANKAPPAWLGGLEDTTATRSARLGLLLAVANPKVVVLAIAGGLAIGSTDLERTQELLAVAGFTAIAILGVAVPYVVFLLLGDRVAHPLVAAKDWLMKNNAAVSAAVFAVLGVLLVAGGVAGLT